MSDLLLTTEGHWLEPDLTDEVGFATLTTLLPDPLDSVIEPEVMGLRPGSTVRP